MSSYVSVARTATVEQVVKRSRFIADVFPVTDEQDVSAALQQVRDTHPAASHICYAFKHSLDVEVVRFSDAGEPGGTAGRPILEVIEREGLRNTLITVTRYFGGTLLGAAGLVRAYTAAAAAGIARAGKSTYVLHQEFSIRVDYPLWGRMERLLADLGVRTGTMEYGAEVVFKLQVAAGEANSLTERLRDLTGGQVDITPLTQVYLPIGVPLNH